MQHTVSAEQVERYLRSFKTGDLLSEDFRGRVINTLIQCVYLYDDKIIVYFNIKGAKSITHIDAIRDAESLAGSDSSRCGEDDFDGLTWDQLTALFDDLVRERGKVAEILEDAENG